MTNQPLLRSWPANQPACHSLANSSMTNQPLLRLECASCQHLMSLLSCREEKSTVRLLVLVRRKDKLQKLRLERRKRRRQEEQLAGSSTTENLSMLSTLLEKPEVQTPTLNKLMRDYLKQ